METNELKSSKPTVWTAHLKLKPEEILVRLTKKNKRSDLSQDSEVELQEDEDEKGERSHKIWGVGRKHPVTLVPELRHLIPRELGRSKTIIDSVETTVFPPEGLGNAEIKKALRAFPIYQDCATYTKTPPA